MADITIAAEYKMRVPHKFKDYSPDDNMIVFGTGAFGATDTAAELDVPLETVEYFDGTCKGATQTTAGEYTVTTDGTIASGAITVCRQGHVDDANNFFFMVIGKPKVAATAAASL